MWELLVEVIDALISMVIVALVMKYCSFPWNAILIGILILPFSIGLYKSIKQYNEN